MAPLKVEGPSKVRLRKPGKVKAKFKVSSKIGGSASATKKARARG